MEDKDLPGKFSGSRGLANLFDNPIQKSRVIWTRSLLWGVTKVCGRYAEAEGAQHHDFTKRYRMISRKNRHRATEQQTRREGPAPGLSQLVTVIPPAASSGPSNRSGPERQKKLENTRIELVTYRMRSGRSTPELIPHLCARRWILHI